MVSVGNDGIVTISACASLIVHPQSNSRATSMLWKRVYGRSCFDQYIFSLCGFTQVVFVPCSSSSCACIVLCTAEDVAQFLPEKDVLTLLPPSVIINTTTATAMKLQLDCANRALHVRTCDWSSTGEMYAYAEDTNSIQVLDRSLRGSKQVCGFALRGQCCVSYCTHRNSISHTQLLALPSPVTDMHVLPYAAQRRSKDVTEIAAIGDVAGLFVYDFVNVSTQHASSLSSPIIMPPSSCSPPPPTPVCVQGACAPSPAVDVWKSL